jgi:hypothetical protein
VVASEEAEGYREVIRYMEEKMRGAKNKEEAWESSEEEEEYDYGQECEEVFCRRARENKFFEEIHFKRDPKHALVYTDTEYMQKQRGVLTHVLK